MRRRTFLLGLGAVAHAQSTDARIADLEQKVKANAKDLAALLKLAAAFLQKNRETTDFSYVDRAAGLVDRALTAQPDHYPALRMRVEIAMLHHRFPKVLEYAPPLIEKHPGDAGLVGLMGDALMERGQYDQAQAAYQRMLDLGGNLTSYNRWGYLQFIKGKTDEALSYMAQAVAAGSREPEHEAWVQVEFGDLLFKTGHVPQARQMYDRALGLIPSYHRAHAALGRLVAAAGDFKEALRHFNQAQAAVPFPEYAAMLAALHRALGNEREAVRQARQVDAIAQLGKASGEKANRTLALIYADENRNLVAALELAKAEFDVRDDLYSHDAYAWALFKNGRVDEARAESDKALVFGTAEPLFYYHAAAIANAQKDAAKVRGALERLKGLNPAFDFRYKAEIASLTKPAA